MRTYSKGIQGLSACFFKHTLKFLFLLMLFASQATAATTFLAVVPGNTYTGSATPTLTNAATQVDGEPFTADVFSYSNTTPFLPQSSLGTTATLSSPGVTSTFNPSGAISLGSTYNSVANSWYRGAQVTLSPTSNSTVAINVTSSNNLSVNSCVVYVPVQVIDHFDFTVSTFNAGTPGSITISARDSLNALCSTFNSSTSVHLYANQAGVNGTQVDLGNLTFTNGIATLSPTFYHASAFAQFQLVRGTNNYYQSFVINPALTGFTKLLLVGPGQIIRSGELNGFGRAATSASINTMAAQTAGINFSMTVYACDAYWNTQTGSGTVSLSSTDSAFTPTGAQSFGTNSFITISNCNLQTVGTGYQTITANHSGSAASNSDIAPVSPSSTLDHFTITAIASPVAVNAVINVTITAFDISNNQLSTVPGTTTMQVQISGTPISSTNGAWILSPALSFTNGKYIGTLRIRKASGNYTVHVANGGVYVDSNGFTVSTPTSANRFLMVLPGQSYTPGEQFNGTWGRSGTPMPEQAGVPFSVSVIATDSFGNIASLASQPTVDIWSGTNSSDLILSDSLATVSPNPIIMTSGQAYPAFTLTRSLTNQQIGVTGTLAQCIISDPVIIYHTGLDHFSVNAGAAQTAGHAFNTVITAQDTYYNAVTSYAGTIYMTCPTLDYLAPTASVLNVTGGTAGYTSGSTTAWWSRSGFVAGQLTVSTYIYRAGTASLYVSTNPNDFPGSATGNTGVASSITVAADGPPASKMFLLVPGTQHRAGAISLPFSGVFNGVGYSGSPLSQQVGTAFSVTAYATDSYWNYVSNSDQVTVSTSNPTQSVVNPSQPTMNAGSASTNITLNQENDFTISVTDPGSGIASYTTPYIVHAFNIFNFTINSLSITGSSTLTAGTPVWVTITAVDSGSAVITTFNGNAHLTVPVLDWDSSTLQVISPQNISFTSGIWQGNVTIYRQDKGGNISFFANLGSLSAQSTTFRVTHALHKKLLILATGMTLRNGIATDIDTNGSLAIVGDPAIETAGTPIPDIKFRLCDDYWNTIIDGVESTENVIVNCSDPYPAVIQGYGSFAGGAQSVSLTAGERDFPNAFTLFTVNGTTGQTISVGDGLGSTQFQLGIQKKAVPVKHADAAFDLTPLTPRFRFRFAPTASNPAVAGVPFAVTVVAVDAYGNTLDSINGTPSSAMPSSKSVALTANTDGGGNTSIWPTKLGTLVMTSWQEGKSYPWLYCYRQLSGTQAITATTDFGAGSRSGTSGQFSVLANRYARVVPIIGGMNAPQALGAGGTYVYTASVHDTTPPTASAAIFNNFGAPSQHTAGNAVNLQAYTCDIFGNTTKYTNDSIRMTTTDIFAPRPANLLAVPANGYADFGALASPFRFHTHGIQRITCADTTVATMTAGTTPNITVVPGQFFGLQSIVPGLVAVEGSGTTNVAAGAIAPVPPNGWYNGVTPTDPSMSINAYNGSAQFAGAYFGVSVQAVDMYGNFVSTAPSHTIKLTSTDLDSTSSPYISNDVRLPLSNGIAFFRIQQRTEGPDQLRPDDVTEPTILGYTLAGSIAIVRVVNESQVDFYVMAQGVLSTANTPVYVDAAPNTFDVRVEIRYLGTGEIVATIKSFVMEASSTYGTFTQTTGTLGLTAGSTFNGIGDVPLQTYNRSGSMYIRVRDAGGTGNPTPGYSPEIRVRASTPARIVLTANTVSYLQNDQTIYQLQANADAQISATVYDANGNFVPGKNVDFSIVEQAQTSSVLQVPQSLVTDANGYAFTTFHAGAQNLEHTIHAVADSAGATLTMFVTVTRNGGVYPNPFNPLRGQNVHIDYTLDKNASVKILIYTLLGDLVWTTDIQEGDAFGGHAGVNSVSWNGRNNMGVMVANGGYICVVKANDQQVSRFKIGVYKEK